MNPHAFLDFHGRTHMLGMDTFWANRTVAVTGATGFVGGHVARLLHSAGARVRVLARPSSDCRELEHLDIRCERVDFNDRQSLTNSIAGCDLLFHLAGAVDFKGNWQRFHEVNVLGTANILTAARLAGIRRSVVTSSIVAVSGSDRPIVFDESATWNLQSLRVPYVTTKRQAEELALRENFGSVEVVVVNPSCVIGPDDVSSEFGVLCHRFWKGRVPFYFGGGSNFVDVRDVAAGHLAAAQHGQPGERYLLSSTNAAWSEFFMAMAHASGRTIPHLWLPPVVGEWFAACESWARGAKEGRPNLSPDQAKMMPMYFYFCNDKAARVLNYRPRSLAETLADMYASWQTRQRPTRRTAA